MAYNRGYSSKSHNNYDDDYDDDELTDEEIEQISGLIKKRRRAYILAWFISFALAVGFNILSGVFEMEALLIVAGICSLASAICASLVVWCINNIRAVESRFTKQGGGLLWLLFIILGGIILPIIIVWILRKAEKLGFKAMGL